MLLEKFFQIDSAPDSTGPDFRGSAETRVNALKSYQHIRDAFADFLSRKGIPYIAYGIHSIEVIDGHSTYEDVKSLFYESQTERGKSLAIALHIIPHTKIVSIAEMEDFGHPFTPKEQLVFDQIILGLTNQEIEEILGMNPHTLHQHVSRIFQKRRVDTRQQLIRLYAE
jgi:DNA-binding CsgD family transcriptional regulator